MSVTLSTNMNLPVPGVGTEAGPDWATDLNACLSIIDAHTHTSGSGVQITPDAININGDLAFNDNNLTTIRAARFTSQSAALTLPADLRCIYAVGVDLYYNDGNGTNIQITSGGGVAGSPGNISGLASPATATYVSGSASFVWQSDANVPANTDTGDLILRNNVASSFGLTVKAPSSMASDRTITFPNLPATTNIMSMTSSGVIASDINVDNSTIQLTSSTLAVKASGITATQILDGTITSAKYGTSSIPITAMGTANKASSSAITYTVTASGYKVVTGLTVTLTCTGSRPVLVCISGSIDNAQIAPSSGSTTMNYRMYRGSTIVCSGAPPAGVAVAMPIFFIDTSPASGSNVYTMQMAANTGSILVNSQIMTAWEL